MAQTSRSSLMDCSIGDNRKFNKDLLKVKKSESAMKLNRDEFLETGYLIVKEAVPRDKLAHVRQAYETLVNRQRENWKAERAEGDPPEASGRPRRSLACNSQRGRSSIKSTERLRRRSRFGSRRTSTESAQNSST